MRCRSCGCSEDDACVDEVTGETCAWAEPGLCTACAPASEFPNLERAGFVLP